MVVPVDDERVDERVAQSSRHAQTAESGADDNDSRPLNMRCHYDLLATPTRTVWNNGRWPVQLTRERPPPA
jgi:hypothetical protein